ATINASAGPISFSATSTPTIVVISVAGAITSGGGDAQSGSSGAPVDFAGAGAGTSNKIKDTIEASATGGSLGSGGAVSFAATDDPSITADAGGVSLATQSGSGGSGGTKGTDLSIGLSVAINEIANDVVVALTNAATSAASVALTGDSTPTIFALTIGGALVNQSSQSNSSGGGLSGAGAGAGSKNTIADGVSITIEGGSVTTTAGDVALTGTDVSKITADAGGIALAKSSGSAATLGAALAIDEVANTVYVAIGNGSVATTVTSAKGVSVDAESAAVVSALTIALAAVLQSASQSNQGSTWSLQGAGSVSYNAVENTITAKIDHATVVASNGSIEVTAKDTTTITADAGGVAVVKSNGGTGLTFGASVAINTVKNTVRALVIESPLTASASINILAVSHPTIDAVSVAGGGNLSSGNSSSSSSGFQVIGAGAVPVNTIENTADAELTGTKSAFANGGDITVDAEDGSTITADTVAGAFALKTGGGSQSGGAQITVAAGIGLNTVT